MNLRERFSKPLDAGDAAVEVAVALGLIEADSDDWRLLSHIDTRAGRFASRILDELVKVGALLYDEETNSYLSNKDYSFDKNGIGPRPSDKL